MPMTLIETLREIEKRHPYAKVSDGSKNHAIEDMINSIDGDDDGLTYATRELEDGRIHIYPMREDGLHDPNGQPWFTVYPPVYN